MNLLIYLLTFITLTYSKDCYCSIISETLSESRCEQTVTPGEEPQEINFDPECDFILSTELPNSIHLVTLTKLTITAPNTFIVEDATIGELDVQAAVSFVNYEQDGKLLINNLKIDKEATFDITFSVDTTVTKHENPFNAVVELGATLSVNGSIDTLSIDGNFLMTNGNVNEIVVTGRSELSLPKKTTVDVIALQTANFHLFVEDANEVVVKRYIFDMNEEYINSISLIHSENKITSDFAKKVKVMNHEEIELDGVITSECLDKEIFYKAKGVEEVVCHPIECIYEKSGKFNLPRCPFEENKDKESFTPTSLVIEGGKWNPKWNEKKVTNIVIDVGKGVKYDLEKNQIKCENFVVRSGEVSLNDVKLNSVVVEKDAVVVMKRVTIASLTAEEDALLNFEDCTILGYTDINGATLKVSHRLSFDKPKDNEDSYKVLLNGISLSLYDGLIVLEKSIEVYIEEMFVETSLFPLFGDNANSRFYFGATVSLNIDEDEFSRLGCVELVRSNDEGLIWLSDGTNVVLDENDIGAFLCFDETEKPVIYVDCKIPKHTEKPYMFTFEEDSIPKECQQLYSSSMSLVFEDEDVVIDYGDYYSVGKIKGKKITIKSDNWDEDKMLSVDFMEAEEIIIQEGCSIDDLTMIGARKLTVNSLLYLGSLYDNAKDVAAYITVASGASVDLSGASLYKAEMTIKNGGSFFADSSEDDVIINQCKFILEPEAVFWINSKAYVRQSTIFISLVNDHALTFNDITFTKTKIFLCAEQKLYDEEKEKIQYIIFSKNQKKLEEVSFAFLVGKTEHKIEPQEECNGEWVMLNKNANDECPKNGVNVRGTEKFVIPQRWIKKQGSGIGKYVIPICMIILVVLILKYFVRPKNGGMKQTNMTD